MNKIMYNKIVRAILVFVLFAGGIFSVFPRSIIAAQLIKGASSPAVYYLFNNQRFAFPNERTYFSWYSDFSQVSIVADSQLATIPLAGNVTYRPGFRMVKITTDPKVYAVSADATLRWVASEEIAQALYGSNWQTQIDDLSDAFFTNYHVGSPITNPTTYDRSLELNANTSFIPPALPTQTVTSNVPKKFLTIMAVNSGAESKYEDNSWERTLTFKENDTMQIFEVAIWNNGQPTNPGKISVYKFDRTFDPYKEEYINGGQAWVQYRERFNILNIDIPASCQTAQGAAYYACSTEYLDAFEHIFQTIVVNQPAEHYGIKYLGHGTNGGLFENKLSENDSRLFLAYTDSIISKKLDFLDWSTNCDMGTVGVISSQYQYADYVLSSDLLRGGFVMDWANDYYRLKPEAILDTFFTPSKTIKQSLIDMVDSERLIWETPTTKNDMIAKQIKQSLSIYDSSKFEDLVSAVHLSQGSQSGDVLEYIRKNYPAQEQVFADFRFHYISNKDFFPWNEDSNGFKF